jgi:hypothetical protein
MVEGMFSTMVHKNVRLSEDIVTDNLISYHLPRIDPVRRKEALVPVEKINEIGNRFKISPLNSCLKISKFTILVKPIK